MAENRATAKAKHKKQAQKKRRVPGGKQLSHAADRITFIDLDSIESGLRCTPPAEEFI
jgi:hypothetical protein